MKNRLQIQHQQMKSMSLKTQIMKFSLLMFFTLCYSFSHGQTLIAGWDFQTVTNGGTAVLAAPNTPTTFNANFGTGALYLNGSNGSSTWTTTTTGNQVSAFSGSAVNAGAGFSVVTTSPACLAVLNTTANGKSIVFSFSMTNYSNLIVTYATQKTSTGFSTQQWDYSTDATNWTPAQTLSSLPTAFALQTLSGINGMNNSATAYLRVTFTGATAAAGNNRLDNIQLKATSSAAPVVATDTAYGNVGVAFSHFTNATNFPTSYVGSGQPAWLNLNGTTGELSGTPTSALPLPGALVTIDAFNANGSGTGTTLVIINKGSQTISFGTLTAATYGGTPFNLTATGGASGNPVTYVSSNPLVATISGNTVTIVGAGSTNITASQAGDVNYNAATNVIQSLTVNQATQTIIFNALPAKVTTDPAFTLNATGGASGNPVTYVSSNTAVATISGNTVTIAGAGTTNITASQAGNANYLAATNVIQAQLVNAAGLTPQTITFNTLPAVTYGVGPISLTATGGGSGNAVTYVSSNTNVATIAGNIMTIHAPGTTTVIASQAGNGSYSAATSVSKSQVVNIKNLTLPGIGVFSKVYDGNANATLFNLILSGVVGGDIVTVNGSATFVSVNVGANISVSTNLTLGGVDSFKYSLTQPSGLTADITEASQTISFASIPVKNFASAPFTLTATGGGSGNPVTFVSGNPLVATISGNTVTIVGAGFANITASQAGNSNYFAAPDSTQILTVNKASQSITFAQLPNHIIGEPPFAITATGGASGNPVTYASSNTSVATVSGNMVTIVGVGTTTITASQTGNANYNAANDVLRTLTITYPIIAAWDLFGVTSPATFAATTFNSNLVSTGNASSITRGATAAANSAGNSFRTTGFQNNGIATSNTDYFQTTLKAAPGYSLSLSSINANFAGTSSFAVTPGVTQQFAYSTDGINFTLIGSPFITIGTPASSPLIDVTSIAALQHIHSSKTVTFRYYASGQTTTGGWGFNSTVAGVNGLAFGGSVDACVPVSNTSNVTICAAALPYTWGMQTINSGGTYTNTAINISGCDSVEILNLTVNPCTNTTLNLTCFIEGYWNGASAMLPTLANQFEPTTANACDSINVELHSENSPYSMMYSVRTVLNQNGTATCIFPSVSGSYYIAVKHRNAVETWSASPVAMLSTTNYNFSDAASKAFNSFQVELYIAQLSPLPPIPSGIFAFYSGDATKDAGESVDLFDLGNIETEISNFTSGYYAQDINGDGNVDILDTPIVENNITNFVYSNHP